MGKPTARALEFVDHTGATYGRVTVLRRLPDGSNRGVFWLVHCGFCDQEKAIPARLLRSRGRRKSCGCKNLRLVSPQVAGLNYVLKNYRVSARNAGRAFTLSPEYGRSLLASECFYCLKPPVVANWKGRREFRYNGIDRIDSDLDYVPGNVRPCCLTCNRAKNAMSDEAFADWRKRLAGAESVRTAAPTPGVESSTNPDLILFWYNDD